MYIYIFNNHSIVVYSTLGNLLLAELSYLATEMCLPHVAEINSVCLGLLQAKTQRARVSVVKDSSRWVNLFEWFMNLLREN